MNVFNNAEPPCTTNEVQLKGLYRLLEGFEGKLTSSK
jgi:hypothetical protein